MNLFGKKKPQQEEEPKMYMPPIEEEKPVNPFENAPVYPIPEPAPEEQKKTRIALKMMRPESHNDGKKIIDKLNEGCILMLDMKLLSAQEKTILTSFLLGAVYAIKGQLKKSGAETLILASGDVDLSDAIAPTEE